MHVLDNEINVIAGNSYNDWW